MLSCPRSVFHPGRFQGGSAGVFNSLLPQDSRRAGRLCRYTQSVARSHPGMLRFLLPKEEHQHGGAVTTIAHTQGHWARTGHLHGASGQHKVKDTEEAWETSRAKPRSLPSQILPSTPLLLSVLVVEARWMLPSVLKCKLQPLTCPSFFLPSPAVPSNHFPSHPLRGSCPRHLYKSQCTQLGLPEGCDCKTDPGVSVLQASLAQGRAAGPEGHDAPLAGRLQLPSLPVGSPPQPTGEAASARPGAGALAAVQLYTWLLGPSHLISKVAFGDVLSNESSLMRDENFPTCGCAFIQMHGGVSKEPQTWVWTENLSLRSGHREVSSRNRRLSVAMV